MGEDVLQLLGIFTVCFLATFGLCCFLYYLGR